MTFAELPEMTESELQTDDRKCAFLLIIPDVYSADDLDFYRMFLHVNDVRFELSGTFCVCQLDELIEGMQDSGIGIYKYAGDGDSQGDAELGLCGSCGKTLIEGKCDYEFCPENMQ